MRIVLLLAVSLALSAAARADNKPLFRYRAADVDWTQGTWTGSPGPSTKLPQGTLRSGDMVALSGKRPLFLSSLCSAEALKLPTGPFRAEAVFAIERPQEWGGLIGFLQDNGGKEKGWVLGWHKDHLSFGLAAKDSSDSDGTMTYLESAGRWEPGRLYHLVGVYDGQEMRLYVNGKLDAKTNAQRGAVIYPDRSGLVMAGYRDDDESHPFAGRLAMVSVVEGPADEAAVAASFAPWSKAVSAAPVATLGLPRPLAQGAPKRLGATSESEADVPTLQHISAAGKQILTPGKRPQGVAVHPGGKYVVATGGGPQVLVIDPVSGQTLSTAVMPSGTETSPSPAADHILAQDPKAQLSFHGLVFSPKGDRLYLSNVAGDIKVFQCDADGRVAPLFSMALPVVKGLTRSAEIPAGLAVSADGSRLYAAFNLSNQLAEIDTATGKVVRTIPVGVAPHDVVIAGGKLYVSCRGGRRPVAGDTVGPAGRGTEVKVDPVIHVASEGSVSVIDLKQWKPSGEILTGLAASGLALHPAGRYLCVANANSDTISVIDTKNDKVVETLPIHWQPKGWFGASPNALCFSPNGKTLYVCNGGHNAVAAVAFDPGESKLAGLVPVGWFPGAIAFAPKAKVLAVANLKGIGSGGAGQLKGEGSFNSHQHTGSISLVPVPDEKALGAYTKTVLANCGRAMMDSATLAPRPDQPLRPVPERSGEPSPIQHIIYIIKENRTYDQVLGDMLEGDGDPFLCIYGEEVSPNQHKIAREFVLMDNMHCCGVLSADGHQWSTSGFATDYLERQFAGWPRSYPDFCGKDEHDALAYSPKGFIWDAALAKGRTVRNYGESSLSSQGIWTDGQHKGKPSWLDHIDNWEKKGKALRYESVPGIPSLAKHSCTKTVGWETSIPDVIRAESFLAEFREFEKTGKMPNLCLMTLPMDHTVGTGKGNPSPAATVADNDLAVGMIVDAVSHSAFWKDTAIFIIEDDPQNGWDHISPYRTTGYVISPYTRRRAVISEAYSQTSILRTMGLILGLAPMNQLDAIATPMAACFQDTPDLRPFDHVPNRISLRQMNGLPQALHPALRRDSLASEKLNWKVVDACPEDTLNRILWRAARGPEVPYPAWAVLADAGDDDDDD